MYIKNKYLQNINKLNKQNQNKIIKTIKLLSKAPKF